jgi:adenylylsulfate kinase
MKVAKRHIAKTLSWRAIGTLDTLLFAWLLSGDVEKGVSISAYTIITKMIWYYLHERAWFKSKIQNPNKRHIYKTFSWRFIGTLDTIIISWIILGNINVGLQIGGAETITKMILYFFHEKLWYRINFGLDHRNKRQVKKEIFSKKASNISTHNFDVTQQRREERLGQKGKLIWFTGLSGSGKSTLSNSTEKRLFSIGFLTYALDGDNVRSGINSDLGFTMEDREENIRRIGEVSKLMLDAGLIVCASFVSPFKVDRDRIKEIIGKENIIEIYVSTPLEECEKRDVKGLYKKARLGEIIDFTGVSSPYEKPENPDIIIDTTNVSIAEAIDKIFNQIESKLK